MSTHSSTVQGLQTRGRVPPFPRRSQKTVPNEPHGRLYLAVYCMTLSCADGTVVVCSDAVCIVWPGCGAANGNKSRHTVNSRQKLYYSLVRKLV